MSIAAWPDLDPSTRYNIYYEELPKLKAKYPTVEVFSEPDFYSNIEPVFFVPNVGTVHLDGVKYGGLEVPITEGTPYYTSKPLPWQWIIFGILAFTGIGVLART